MKVAILYICTGSYDVYFDGFYETAKKLLLPDCSKQYFVWTTNTDKIPQADDITIFERPKEKWPLSVMKKFHYFLDIEEELKGFDYCIYFNANCKFIRTVLSNHLHLGEKPLFATKHCYENDVEASTEKNPLSKGYIPHSNYEYICSGLFGGVPSHFIDMCKELDEWAQHDVQNNTIPVWHDESLLNAWALQHEDIFYKLTNVIWDMKFDPHSLKNHTLTKILLRDKQELFPDILEKKDRGEYI